MSTRILIEFNMDRYSDLPAEIQRLIDMFGPEGRYSISRSVQYPGVARKWERHHSSPCPVEYYADLLGTDVKRT